LETIRAEEKVESMAPDKSRTSSWFNRIFEPSIDFYALLNSHAQKVLAGMEALEAWIKDGAKGRCQIVRDLEREADELKLEIERTLSDAFVTPFDREDIYDLSMQLDEIINAAKAAVREIEALELKFEGPMVDEMVCTLVEGTRCLKLSFSHLGSDSVEAANQATLARKSENRFSRTYRTAVRELFTHDDFKIVMKTHEVYRTLVHASERIDDVGEKLLHVIVKMT